MRPSISVRSVTLQDAPVISALMHGLGFDHSVDEITRRLNLAPDRTTDPAVLAEGVSDEPVGLLAVHIAPLLFYPQPLARIIVAEPPSIT